MFVYVPIYQVQEKPDLSALACMPGQKPASDNGLITTYIPIGGVFKNFKGEEAQPCSSDIVFRYEDKIENMKDYLADYMGVPSQRDETGYIGPWPKDEEIEHLYYYIDPQERQVYKFFFTKAPQTLQMTPNDGWQYFVEKDGNMVSAIPTPGDIILDNMQEVEVMMEYFTMLWLATPQMPGCVEERPQIEEQQEPLALSCCSPEFKAIYAKQLKKLQESLIIHSEN